MSSRAWPQVGDKVTATFDGRIIGYDPDAGHWLVRGNTRGAQHINWDVPMHWATEFEPFTGEAPTHWTTCPHHTNCPPDCSDVEPGSFWPHETA